MPCFIRYNVVTDTRLWTALNRSSTRPCVGLSTQVLSSRQLVIVMVTSSMNTAGHSCQLTKVKYSQQMLPGYCEQFDVQIVKNTIADLPQNVYMYEESRLSYY